MADGDYYGRRVGWGWRKVANAVDGGQQLDLIAALASKAYAETMRHANGVPGLNALADAVSRSAHDGDRTHWTTGSDETSRTYRHHANTEIAIMEGERLLENHAQQLRGLSRDEIAQELAESTTKHIVAHHLERSQGPNLPERFQTAAELRAFQRRVGASMPVRELAAEMLRHEDGSGFASPRRRTPAAGTAALINLPLGAL